MSSFIQFCNTIIRYSFYSLFIFVPLFFTGNTSELFELNKMWITWGLTVVIMTAWICKMALEKGVYIKRTPLDIPILLFLTSQLIATFISLDPRVSFWGYYSRFNGGFLSLLSYVLLYYAFVSNLTLNDVKRLLYISIGTGVIVALWGLPSHFGYDPTCYVFRGTLDVSCWTDAFKPTVRIFSTLGQPAWMAAYLSVLLPITMSLALWHGLKGKDNEKNQSFLEVFNNKIVLMLILITVLFYVDLLYTNTRGGFLAFWGANILFWGTLILSRLAKLKQLLPYLVMFNLIFLTSSFFIGTPITQLDPFTAAGLRSRTVQPNPQPQPEQPSTPVETDNQLLQTGISDSADIRLHVWKGAIDAWKANPIFGTGVETFAYAYYRHRPAAHNMTSEWDYLYNKAHNEYLNYLTTTGAVGLGSYLLLIGLFLFLFVKQFILPFFKDRKKIHVDLENGLLAAALPASFISILISNFFGFSVVIINLYLFFLPLWYFYLTGTLSPSAFARSFGQQKKHDTSHINPYQWTAITISTFIGLVFLYLLIRFWIADTAYALGYNLNRVGEYQQAYLKLQESVDLRRAEPVFKEEYAINLATLGTALYQNNQASFGAQLSNEAIALSNEITTNHPNNVVFWKSRVRIFYLLSQIDPQYLQPALQAIEKAHELAPTDAKIAYNLGVLQGQNNQVEKAIQTLTQTIKLKPNYRDPYYARALFYHQLATNESGAVVNPQMQEKAVADLRFILTRLHPEDQDALKTLESWGVATESLSN